METFDEFHRDVCVTVRFTNVVDRDDIGVAQAREGPSFAQRAQSPTEARSHTGWRRRSCSPRTKLRQHNGNVAVVARELGKAAMQVRRWVRKYGIDLTSFRP